MSGFTKYNSSEEELVVVQPVPADLEPEPEPVPTKPEDRPYAYRESALPDDKRPY